MAEQTVKLPDCRDCTIHCKRRSDWDFLKDFYAREESARIQVRDTNNRNAQLLSALQAQGAANQNDRILLINCQAELEATKATLGQSEQARARTENKLHEVRQEYRGLQEAFTAERLHHQETQKQLNHTVTSNTRLAQILKEVKGSTSDPSGQAKLEGSVDVSQIVADAEHKSTIIDRLQGTLQMLEEKLNVESAEYQTMLAEKSTIIDDLECKLGEVRREAAEARRLNNDDQRRQARRRGSHLGPNGARSASAMPEYGRGERAGEAGLAPYMNIDRGNGVQQDGRAKRMD